MSSGCGDVLSLEDLRIAKQHQLFEAEVITGKQGGVASGADIDYATNQATGQIQKTMPAVLRDIGYEPATFDFVSGGTLSTADRNKAVLWPLSAGGDGDYYYWEGVLPKVIPAGSTPASTGGIAEGAWRPVGDVLLRDQLISPTGEPLVSDRKVSMQSGGRLSDVINYVTPEQFGAKGDGATDDTAAIQAAIDYVAGQGGGTVELSAKMYRAAGIVLKPMVYLKGQGVNLTVIKAPDGWDEVAVIYSVDFTEYVDQDKTTLPVNGAYGAAIHKLHINGNYDNFGGTPARLYGHGLALGGLIHLSEVEVMYCPSSCLAMFNYQGGPNQPPSWWPADKGLYANAVHGDVACKWAGYDTIIMYTPDNVFSNLLVGMSARGQVASDLTTRSLWDPSRICVVADFLSGVTILKGHFYAGLVGAIFRGTATRWDYIVMETVSVGFWTTTTSQVQGGVSDIHNCDSSRQLTGIPAIGNSCPAFIIQSGGTGTSNSELASDYGTINVLNYTVSSTQPDIYFCGIHGWIDGKHNQVKVNIQRSRFLAAENQHGGIGLILQGKQCTVAGQIVGFWKTDYSGNTSCAVQVQPDATFKVDLTIARCALGFRWSSSSIVSGRINFAENVNKYTDFYSSGATLQQCGMLEMTTPYGGNRCAYSSTQKIDVTTTATQTINVPVNTGSGNGLPYIPRLGEVNAYVVNTNQPQTQYAGLVSVQYEPASSSLTNLVFKVRMKADSGDSAGAVLIARIN